MSTIVTDASTSSLASIVQALCLGSVASANGEARHAPPSRAAVAEVMDQFRATLFPRHAAWQDHSPEALRWFVGSTLESALRVLEDQIHGVLAYSCSQGEHDGCAARAKEMAGAFAARLPAIQELLASDVRAAYEGDPAAKNTDEIIFCYPGLTAVVHHRIAHELHRLGVPLLPRMISEAAHALTGVDIHPGARIGRSFFIDHGTGVVIGETAILGDRVRLYHGVTLGAKSFPLDAEGHPIKGIDRHPVVEDDVVIYAGATILGRITIGRGSTIGGNVWVTHSVPPGTQVAQAKSRTGEGATNGNGGSGT